MKVHESSGNSHRIIIKGDSWFGLVRAATALAQHGIEGVLQVKTGHSLYPKEFITETLKGMPGGIHVVLKGNHDGIDLVAIGYRYSSKKTLFFIMTENAGSTKPGEPYQMKFTDIHGNIGE